MRTTAAIVALVLVAVLALGATSNQWRLRVLETGLQYHDGTSGVSGFPVPGGFVEQAIVQAQDGTIRFTLDGIGPVTGTTGFKLKPDEYFEICSGHMLRDFRWKPESGATATVVYVLLGR